MAHRLHGGSMNITGVCRLEPPSGYTPPEIPANEKARLEELHHLRVLDTPAEERFDRIVRLAATLFRAPIAYVALIDDDRQWFKSRVGMKSEETPRHSSFCGHAILQDAPLIIADARRDLRFASNPMVVGEPFVRFYAGQPVRGPGGHKIGTLCVLDRSPRTLAEHEVLLLQELGAVIEDEFALRLALDWQSEAIRANEALVVKERELSRTVRELQSAKQRSDELIHSILPSPLATELHESGTVTPVHYDEVAVLFADFSGFTTFASNATPGEVVTELNDCFCHFDWVMASTAWKSSRPSATATSQ
jgi:GAF domain/Adenylate and Guanylate cyclase catalytic domain/Heme NO binding associated